MFTPTIQNMTDKVMRKRPFTRLITSDTATALSRGYPTAPVPPDSLNMQFEYLTYADYLRELTPTAHRIMSPLWYPDIEGVDPETKRPYCRKVARFTTNLPQVFTSQRTSMLIGDHLDIKLVGGGISQKMQDNLSFFSEGWDLKDMENALYELVLNCFGIVDSAIVFYLDNSEVGWKSLNFQKGDILYPHYNSFGRLCLFGRRYKMSDGENDLEYLDVWDDTNYMRYVRGKDASEWKQDVAPSKHGFPRCPVSYHRRQDSAPGPAMPILDNLDLAMSQFCENNKQYALRIFYALGADVDVQGTIDGRPMTVTSTDTNSKVGFLEPADASASFEFQAKQLIASAYQAAHCIQPVEIKSGADISSLTVQMMSKDSYHQALLDAKEFQPAINDLVELFKYGYGIELKKTSDFQVLKVKGTLNPYIMRSEVEEVNNISILTNAGALPRKAAANEAAQLGYGTARNYEEIQQEEHDALVADSLAAAEAAKKASVNPVNNSRNQ